ncbi:CTP synthetase [Shimia sp. Alg240-R146]|uniref:CTP synthetase n=1 Tax=Shimia sp. Alg240-R146 TaxID=2993449 RepID=UPI0022E29CCF|nr:CTP synthetase [Shimia sp. Alg240-R146]
MLQLSLILHLFIGATLSGVAIVVALVAGFGGLWTILGAAVAGFLIAFPISWVIAKRIYDAE